MNNTVNPMQLVQMIKSGQNPQQLMMYVLETQGMNSPMGANLLSLVKQGRTKDIESIARNLAKERGLDFDKEFTAFRQTLGL